jgi:hypothetical protein
LIRLRRIDAEIIDRLDSPMPERAALVTGASSVALCPTFVDTPMTGFVREHVRRSR